MLIVPRPVKRAGRGAEDGVEGRTRRRVFPLPGVNDVAAAGLTFDPAAVFHFASPARSSSAAAVRHHRGHLGLPEHGLADQHVVWVGVATGGQMCPPRQVPADEVEPLEQSAGEGVARIAPRLGKKWRRKTLSVLVLEVRHVIDGQRKGFHSRRRTAMRPLHIDDHVRLVQDIPESFLSRGEVGIVRSTWFSPATAYEVEFQQIGSDYQTRVLVRPEQVRLEELEGEDEPSNSLH